MIITLVAATGAAIVAAAAGYMAARRRPPAEAARRALQGRIGSPARPSPAKGAATPAPAAAPALDLPLALGDVIVAGEEERWLAGALLARERGRVVSALFIAPEGAKTGAVAAFALPVREIFWLEPTEVNTPAEPPGTLEIGAAMLTRKSRFPVAVERAGQGAPHVGDSVLWASYEGSGREVAVVLAGGGRAHAWVGRRLDPDEYERLGAGGTDDSI